MFVTTIISSSVFTLIGIVTIIIIIFIIISNSTKFINLQQEQSTPFFRISLIHSSLKERAQTEVFSYLYL